MTGSMRNPPTLKDAKWLNDPKLQSVLTVLNAAGEARIAGGAVRNALIGIPISDIDIATSVLPKDVMALGKGAGFAVHPTGIEHGTVTVVNRAAVFEVTTLRRDVETDGRRAMVTFTRSFEEDAQRRDFTINSLFCSSRGEISDFTNGYADILKKRIRFVGKPSERIKEDYLRILRFFRFHAAYGKGRPDSAGLAACTRLKSGLKGISSERIRQELFKLLAAPGAVETLKVMAKAGILKLILPYTEDWRALKRLPAEPLLRLFALAKKPVELKETLRLSNEEDHRLQGLLACPDLAPALRPQERRAILHRFGASTWKDTVHISWARSRATRFDLNWQQLLGLADEWTPPDVPVRGADLIKAGYAAGPELGEILRDLTDYWIAGDFKATKDELMQRAGDLKP